MPSSAVRVCLVGAGGHGRLHLRALRVLQAEGVARLAAVVDPTRGRHAVLQRRLAAEGVQWFEDWETYLRRSGAPRAVIVSAPIHLHFDYARRALECGAHVYLEKPPVPVLSQMEALLAAERAAGGARVQVGFSFPFSPQMRMLGHWLRSGRLGPVESYRIAACWPRDDAYYGRCDWAGALWRGGLPVVDGPVTNAMAHRIHDVLWLEAQAGGRPVLPLRLRAELYRARPIASYDTGALHCEFPSGATLSFVFTHACGGEDTRMDVATAGGVVRFRGIDMAMRAPLAADVVHMEEPSHHEALRSFFRAASAGTPPEMGLRDCLGYVRTTNAMLLSSRRIHPIGAEHVTPQGPAGNAIYRIADIEELARACFRGGRTFAEAGAPWGVPGVGVAPGEITAEGVDRLLLDWAADSPARLEDDALSVAGEDSHP